MAVLALLALSIRLLARQIVRLDLSRNRVHLQISDLAARSATFRRNNYTTAEGAYSVNWRGGGFARVGEICESEDGHVSRTLTWVSGQADPGITSADWSGQYFERPGAVGDYEDVEIDTELGPAPAWYFPGPSHSRLWVIHVHGSRVTRLSPLRGVAALADTEAHSLVISYRGDGEGPAHPQDASTLGQTEWPDLDPAISYALEHGAERVVLMGWSMGGTMALLAAERSNYRHEVESLILVGPVTNWEGAIMHGARAARVPKWLGTLAIFALASPTLARVLKFGRGVDFDALDWTSRARISKPCLVIHSAGDDEVPFQFSETFAALNPSVVLQKLPDALHTFEWNRSPELFSAVIRDWLCGQR